MWVLFKIGGYALIESTILILAMGAGKNAAKVIDEMLE
jgi:hypothetical protein